MRECQLDEGVRESGAEGAGYAKKKFFSEKESRMTPLRITVLILLVVLLALSIAVQVLPFQKLPDMGAGVGLWKVAPIRSLAGRDTGTKS